MTKRTWGWALVTGGLVAGGTYLAWVAVAWRRYGRVRIEPEAGELLERFMPACDVRDEHRVRVAAPAAVTYAAACAMELWQLPVVRLIFRLRELVFRSGPPATQAWPTRGLIAETKAMGWVVLAEEPGREIVMGAVTQPWLANPVFRGVPPAEFAAFAEPGYVRIAWTLRVEPRPDGTSEFHTDTRAAATGAAAARLFRPYWAWLSPGIVLIRLLSLVELRRAAARIHSSRCEVAQIVGQTGENAGGGAAHGVQQTAA